MAAGTPLITTLAAKTIRPTDRLRIDFTFEGTGTHTHTGLFIYSESGGSTLVGVRGLTLINKQYGSTFVDVWVSDFALAKSTSYWVKILTRNDSDEDGASALLEIVIGGEELTMSRWRNSQ